jgi:putative membrane protein
MRTLTITLAAALGGVLAIHPVTAADQTAPAKSSTTREMSSPGGNPAAATANTMSGKDADMAPTTAAGFVQKVAVSDMFEIQSSNLAMDKASNKEIKDFAKMMVKDHTDSTQKLKDTLKKSNSKIEPPATLDDKHAQKLEKLRGLSGTEFDKQYVMDQQEGHDAAANLLKSYSQNGDNKDLKQFASQVLPVVETHRSHIKKMDMTPRSASK